MTAEIAILNKSAVALAADSKVTISAIGSTKTYDTINKVFRLSKIHPVGIMIFGNAEFMEYPWETIIKLYRDNNHFQQKATIAEWSSSFLHHLGTFTPIDELWKIRNVYNILQSWFFYVSELGKYDAAKRRIEISSQGYIKLLKDKFSYFMEKFEKSETILDVGALDSTYRSIIRDAADDFFSRHASDESLEKLVIEFSTVVLSKNIFSPQSSGFVIAGFGKDECFPSVFEFETDGYIGNSLKISRKRAMNVSLDHQSYVMSFAQHDMVERFMTGLDPVLKEFMKGLFLQSLNECGRFVLDEYGNHSQDISLAMMEIEKDNQQRARNIYQRVENYIHDNFSSPIVQMVALLPKNDLAHLAESFVSLTSLKGKLSVDLETVGGPIDVALISKSDGFVWTKRKRYYPEELNPHLGPRDMWSEQQERRTDDTG